MESCWVEGWRYLRDMQVEAARARALGTPHPWQRGDNPGIDLGAVRRRLGDRPLVTNDELALVA